MAPWNTYLLKTPEGPKWPHLSWLGPGSVSGCHQDKGHTVGRAQERRIPSIGGGYREAPRSMWGR